MDSEALFVQFWPALVAYFLRRTHDPMLAEDLAAQVFLKALEAERRGYGLRAGRGYRWLYTISRHLWLDHLHSVNVRDTLGWEEAFPADDPQAPAPDLNARLDAASSVAHLLTYLTVEQRQVIELYDLEGYDNPETAAIVGKTIGAVKGLRHRGLTKLNQVTKRTAPSG